MTQKTPKFYFWFRVLKKVSNYPTRKLTRHMERCFGCRWAEPCGPRSKQIYKCCVCTLPELSNVLSDFCRSAACFCASPKPTHLACPLHGVLSLPPSEPCTGSVQINGGRRRAVTSPPWPVHAASVRCPSPSLSAPSRWRLGAAAPHRAPSCWAAGGAASGACRRPPGPLARSDPPAHTDTPPSPVCLARSP